MRFVQFRKFEDTMQVIPDADAADHLIFSWKWDDQHLEWPAWNFQLSEKVSVAILSISSSSYYCKSLCSTMNSIKSDIRNNFTDDLSAAGVESSFEE